MSSLISKTDGLFNPTLRFAFTNITDEVFTSYWDKIPIVVQAGQTIEISNTTPIIGAGHAIANKMTDELVDKIMITEVKLKETEYYKNNINAIANTYRAPSSLGVPAARKVWEDKIVRALGVDEESPTMQAERNRIKAEITGQLQAQKSTEPPPVPTMGEFAEIQQAGTVNAPVIKKPARVKTIKNETPKPKAE